MASPTDAFRPFREFDTLEEGFRACALEGAESLPFVVRGGDKTWASLAAIRKQLSFEASVKGYAVNGVGETVYMSGRDTLTNFDDGTMVAQRQRFWFWSSVDGVKRQWRRASSVDGVKRRAIDAVGYGSSPKAHNVVDAEATRSATALLSDAMASISGASTVDRENWCAYVVSLPQHGALHCDPPYGSAWQYLASGEKVWFALANNTFSLQSFAGATKAPDMASLSLLHACYRVVIRPGDFVSVPMAWAHAVDTRTAAIGLSGYSASTMLRPRSPEAEDY